MSASKEYMALSNFFKNTQGISREEIKVLLKEVVKSVIQDEISRFMQTRQFTRMFSESIKNNMYDIRQDVAPLVLDELLKRIK